MHNLTGVLLVLLVKGETVAALCAEADAASEVLQLACAGVGGHDDDRVAEIDETSVAVSQPSFVKHLQQQVENVGMGLLNLVEQHDGVGVTAHTLSELASLLIADVSRRSADETAGVERLGVLAHVNADEGILRTEHELSQLLGQIGLADTRGTEEHEDANGMVGVFQAHTVALYGAYHLLNG